MKKPFYSELESGRPDEQGERWAKLVNAESLWENTLIGVALASYSEGGRPMIGEYIDEALKRAHYEIIDDEEPYYGEIKELKDVWATGKTLEGCRSNLRDVVEGWIILSIKKGLIIPKLGEYEIREAQESAA